MSVQVINVGDEVASLKPLILKVFEKLGAKKSLTINLLAEVDGKMEKLGVTWDFPDRPLNSVHHMGKEEANAALTLIKDVESGELFSTFEDYGQ